MADSPARHRLSLSLSAVFCFRGKGRLNLEERGGSWAQLTAPRPQTLKHLTCPSLSGGSHRQLGEPWMGQAEQCRAHSGSPALSCLSACDTLVRQFWEAGAGAVDGCYPCLPAQSAEDGLCRRSGLLIRSTNHVSEHMCYAEGSWMRLVRSWPRLSLPRSSSESHGISDLNDCPLEWGQIPHILDSLPHVSVHTASFVKAAPLHGFSPCLRSLVCNA